MHPLSPLARGWIAAVVVIGAWINTVVNGYVDGATRAQRDNGPGSDSSDPPAVFEFFFSMPSWMFYGSMAVIGAVLAVVGSLYVWWFTRYQVTGTHVRLRTGLVFRSERQTRLDRVQALDIHRPLVPRLLGLAELRFEVADAGESSVVLRYLKHDHARRLRKDLLGAIGPGARSAVVGTARAAQTAPGRIAGAQPGDDGKPGGGEEAGENEELILSLPLKRVILARILTISFILTCLVTATAAVLGFMFPRVIVPTLVGFIPGILALGGSVLKALEVSWGFKMYRTPDGLRLRYGLLNKTSQTVPTGRIQALALYRPPLWRPAGWSLVHVNVAGYGVDVGSESAGSRSVLLPVATDADLHQLFTGALSIPDGSDLTGLAVEGLVGEADATSRFINSPARVRWVAPVVRRRYGFAVTPHMLVARAGRAYRMCFLVPHNKLQSIGMTRGPLSRRLGLANVHLHSIVGAVRPEIMGMDLEVATRFIPEQLERGRQAPVIAALTQSTAERERELPPLPWATAGSVQPAPAEPCAQRVQVDRAGQVDQVNPGEQQ